MTPGLYVSPTEFRSFAENSEPLKGPLAGQIATRLAAGDMTSFFGLLPNPDPVLRTMGKQIEVYRNLLADPLVMGARRRRAGAVLAMERGFDPEQSKRTPARVLKALEAALSELDVQRIVRDLMDGAFFGYRVAEVMWGARGGIVAPLDLIGKPSEWFGFEPEDARLKFRPRMSSVGVDVPERKFVVVGKMRSWENPYGEPDLGACFWPVTFKRAGLKFWMTFTEKYGMPWAVGKLPRTATQADHNDLADKLVAMVRDAVATIPDDSSVELLTMTGSFNADLYERLLMFCRSEISIALLGNNQSVELQSNKASATAAHQVEKELRDDDAEMVAAGFNQLVRWMCEVNWPGVVPPVYAFYEQEEVDEVLATRDERLKKAGLNFTRQYWMRAYKLEEGDVGPDAPPAAPTQPNGNVPDTQINVPGGDAASFAEPSPSIAATAADMKALDAAVDALPAQALQGAMQQLLQPVLDAIATARTPDEVQAALVQTYPEMDSGELEEMLARALFVADMLGRARASAEAQSNG
jgi:phage gp29-like protein